MMNYFIKKFNLNIGFRVHTCLNLYGSSDRAAFGYKQLKSTHTKKEKKSFFLVKKACIFESIKLNYCPK